MSCENCGSSRHASEDCSTLHLTKALLGKPHDPTKLPDYVSVMSFDDFIAKTEDEIHDELVNLKKITRTEDIQ